MFLHAFDAYDYYDEPSTFHDNDDDDDQMFGVVCSANNASILIECTGSAKSGENNNEDADADAGDDNTNNHEDVDLKISF